MDFRFDGLRTILGNAAAAIPEADAPAVDTTLVAAAPVAVAKASNGMPTGFPDLSDLDRGLFPADSAPVKSSPRMTIITMCQNAASAAGQPSR